MKTEPTRSQSGVSKSRNRKCQRVRVRVLGDILGIIGMQNIELYSVLAELR